MFSSIFLRTFPDVSGIFKMYFGCWPYIRLQVTGIMLLIYCVFRKSKCLSLRQWIIWIQEWRKFLKISLLHMCREKCKTEFTKTWILKWSNELSYGQFSFILRVANYFSTQSPRWPTHLGSVRRIFYFFYPLCSVLSTIVLQLFTQFCQL